MTRIIAFILAGLAVAGCGEQRAWVAAQHERCRAMSGRGAFEPNAKLFECFYIPRSLKIDFNKEIKRQPGVTILFTSTYTP